jgi:hypothetical protein
MTFEVTRHVVDMNLQRLTHTTGPPHERVQSFGPGGAQIKILQKIHFRRSKVFPVLGFGEQIL